MSGDYKYEMQLRAEEIAEQKYGCEYYDLSHERRTEVFTQAMHDWNNDRADRADFILDSRKSSDLQ